MPPLIVRCVCGKAISVAEKHRGRQIRCRECGRTLQTGDLPGAYTAASPNPARNRWVNRARTVSWAYVAVVSVLGMLLWGLGDVWWPATILLFIGRWILLLPLAILVPAVFLFRGTARASLVLLAPLALAALVVVWPIMGFRTGMWRLVPHGAGLPVRVVTFNVDGGERLALQLQNFLDDLKPDVVAFQECGDNLQAVIKALPGWQHHVVRELCLMSRYPILESDVMDRSALEQVNESRDAGIGGSGDVARYFLETPAGGVTITNLQLETPRKGLEGLLDGTFDLGRLRGNTELRVIESRLARRWVNKGHAPTLIAGDFNTPVESRIFQESWGDFTDAFSSAGFGLGFTKDNGWIKVRIDHVLTGPGWHVDRVATGLAFGSDHLPVIVDLTLGKPR
jgi:endonuclease/exonuclease/phosphatase (EEP) superfamily protein YafD